MLKSQSWKYKVIVRKSKVPKITRIKIYWKEQIRGLSTSLNNLWERWPTKGGGGLRPPPHFVGVSQNYSNCCLRYKVSYFFLSIRFGLQRLSQITFCGPWTCLNINFYSFVWHSAFIFAFSCLGLLCKLRNLVALRGATIHENSTCESTKVTVWKVL